MNISYRTVWNHAIGAWVAVSEIARGRGKHGDSARVAAGALAVAALVLGGGSAMADTVVDSGTYVVDSDGKLGVDRVVVDNTGNADATLQVNPGIRIGNEIIVNNQGTLNNAGTLTRIAAGMLGVRSDVGGAMVNNAATGRIEGASAGVSLGDGGTVTNSGGTITAVDIGVHLEAGGDVRNIGAGSVISATGADSRGVFVSSGSGTVTNEAGRITGGLNGVVIWGPGSVTNNGGTISATTDVLGHGVEIVAGTGRVINQGGGIITGLLYGVSLADGGTVTNTASTIRADGSDPRAAGIGISGGPGTVTNTGAGSLIQGPSAGVRLIEGGTVTNGAGATIRGAASVQVISGSTTLSNAGTLEGDVLLDSARSNQVTLYTGSSIRGNLRIGGAAASTLTLDGAGVQRYSDAVSGTTTFGTGTLVKAGSGTWTLDQASARTGGTSLKAGRLNLGHNQALGTGALAMDDGTTLGFAADGLTIANAIHMTGRNDPVIDTGAFSATLAGIISGGGFLTKQGTGSLTFAGANVYTGATNVAEGTLKAGAAHTFSAGSAHSVATGATLDTAGFNQTVAALANAGTVNLRSATGTVGSTLTVAGPYVGTGGVLQVATALGDSASASDRLLLSGANAVASGNTQVQVTNVAGLGALTTGNGIAVVATENGGRIDGNAFSLTGGHVDAGAFEYRMTTDASGAWLRSNNVPGPSSTPLYRTEVPLVAALAEQLREANLAMLANRHQRVGDGIGAAPAGSRQAWGRILTVQRDIGQGGVISPQSHGRLTGFQTGTDLFADGNAEAQWQAGLYVGQLDGDMSASGFSRGIANLQAGRNTLKNQYLGAYGSYQRSSGLYAEAVLQAARHRYGVEAITNTGVHGNGKGSSLLASLEVGQSFALAPGWRIEPQLQIVHQSLDLNDLALGGLTTVSQHTKSGWSLRAGVRVQGELATAIGTLKPYGRLNVYKSPNGTDRASYRTPATLTVIGTPIGGTRTEVAAGATLALSERTRVYGEIGQLGAGAGTTRTRGGVNVSVGMAVRW